MHDPSWVHKVYAVRVSSGKMREQIVPLGERADVAAVEIARLEEEVRGLLTALTTNRVISLAIGLVMERHSVDRETARMHLVRLSQDSNTKLAVLAEELVRAAESPA